MVSEKTQETRIDNLVLKILYNNETKFKQAFSIMYTCNMCLLLDKSSSNLDICSIKDLLSSTNFFPCTIKRIKYM